MGMEPFAVGGRMVCRVEHCWYVAFGLAEHRVMCTEWRDGLQTSKLLVSGLRAPLWVLACEHGVICSEWPAGLHTRKTVGEWHLGCPVSME